MAETILVRADISPRLIEAGRELVAGLDSRGQEFEAAFWLMDEEFGRWHLFLSSQAVKFDGMRAQYAEVRKISSTLGLENDIPITMISIVGHRTPLVKALRKAVRTAATVDGVRLEDAFIGNIYIPACLLYRLSKRQKHKPVTSEVRK
jgi:hypothetical protein